MNTTPYDELALPEAAEQLGKLLRHIDRLVLFETEDDERELKPAIEILILLNAAKATLANLYSVYESEVADALEDEYQVVMPGGITVERKVGKPRKEWDHDGLKKEVARRIAESRVNMETGEILLTDEQMIERILAYGAVSYWRVKQLKALGLNADNYSGFGDEKVSVSISRPKG